MACMTAKPGHRTRLVVAIVACSALLAFGSCGDSDGDGGAAGGAAAAGTIGQPCDSGCGNGLSCGRSSAFVGLCTASCNNDPSCIQLATGTRCYGEMIPECGRPCAGPSDCLPGTTCNRVVGGQMACILTR